MLEDSKLTGGDLRRDGYTDGSHHRGERKRESYEDFIERVAVNSLARRVKLADLEDNLNVHRLCHSPVAAAAHRCPCLSP